MTTPLFLRRPRRSCATALVALGALGVIWVTPVAAQTPDLFLHGVPTGTAQPGAIALTLTDAVTRGLQTNLALVQQQTRAERADADQTAALAPLLPQVTGTISAMREKVSLAAFGFTGFPGAEFPTLVGPFNVVDARVTVSGSAVDLAGGAEYASKRATARAEAHTTAYTREQIIYAIALLYEQALTADSRVAATKAQADTAEALARLAHDQKNAGIVAGIDAVRQDVALEAAKQRVVMATNEAEKTRLRLARAIGLPLGQAFTLAGTMKYVAAPELTLDAAVAQAYADREDLKSATERTKAADDTVRAAFLARFPTVHFEAAYGKIGNDVSSTLGTFSAAAFLRVPLFDGSNRAARAARASAELTARKAEADDQRAGVYYEVRAALLDVSAAEAAVKVATEWRALATQQLTQARDRFAAGIANSIELSQAQDTVATAEDNYIATLYAHVLAKAGLARAVGMTEAALTQYLGGLK